MGLFGKKFKARCLLCKQEFKDEGEYKIHIETLHPLEKPCRNCKGIMKIPPKNDKNGIAVMSKYFSWPPIANFYICETCGYMELYMQSTPWH